MALSGDQKLDVVKTKFKEKIDSYSDWDLFKTFLSNLTKTQVKNFIKSAIADEATKLTSQSDDLDTMAVDYGNLDTEIDGI